jgi:catechol 2,3-dioxygenase-like lactoylglutathione lyase family enzyme
MKFEHIGRNVPDACAMGRWYVEHLGMRIVRSQPHSPYIHFLADDEGRVCLEIYTNEKAVIPDYSKMDPLTLGLTFAVEGPAAAAARLKSAGATVLAEEVGADGAVVVLMRDPWGVPLQLRGRAGAAH